MTAERLIECIGMIDEKLISEALEYAPKRRPKHIAAYLSAAACVCIAVTAAVIIGGRNSDIETIPESSLTTIIESREHVQTTYNAPAETTWHCEPPETEKTAPTVTESDKVFTAATEATSVTSETTASLPESTTSSEITSPSESAAETGSVSDNPETALVPRWEELSELERYPEIILGERRYSLAANLKFTEEDVYFLKNGEVTGMDEYTGEIKTKKCGLYAVRNFDTDYMLAICVDDGTYVGYTSVDYKTETLKEYLIGTNFFGRYEDMMVQSLDMYDDEGSYYISYDLDDADALAEEFLLSNGDAPHVSERISQIEGIYWMDGIYIVIRVYKGGYLHVAGMGADRYFYIGEEAYDSLLEYLEENAETEKVYYIRYSDVSGDDVDILE